MLTTKLAGSFPVQAFSALALVLGLTAGCAGTATPKAAAPAPQPAAETAAAPAAQAPAAVETPAPAAAASEVVLAADHPDRYVVVKGDTLWDISERFLRDPWMWPEVWHANPQIRNPHLIYPGDVITLVYVDGRPRLQLQRAGVDKLSPQVRAEPLEGAIPTIPIDAIQQFLTRSAVLTKEEIDNSGYIVQSADEHLITGTGDRIYARRLASSGHGQYTVFRPGREYRDPDTDESLGYEALFVADAAMQRDGDPATLLLQASTRESIIGDRLVPTSEREIGRNFMPHAPAAPVSGRIIAVLDGVTQIGQYQVVVLNRGARDGMEAGHVLAVYQTGETIRDTVSGKRNDKVTLPDEYAGVLMVFRPFERVSYALIMKATRAIHVLDAVRNP